MPQASHTHPHRERERARENVSLLDQLSVYHLDEYDGQSNPSMFQATHTHAHTNTA